MRIRHVCDEFESPKVLSDIDDRRKLTSTSTSQIQSTRKTLFPDSQLYFFEILDGFDQNYVYIHKFQWQFQRWLLNKELFVGKMGYQLIPTGHRMVILRFQTANPTVRYFFRLFRSNDKNICFFIR